MKPLEGLDRLFQRALEKLSTTLETTVLLKMQEHEPEWIDTAGDICRKWAQVYTKKSLLIMTNKGTKKEKKPKRDVDWNQELVRMKVFKTDMESFLRKFQAELLPLLRWLPKKLGDLLDEARADIAGLNLKVMGVTNLSKAFTMERTKLSKSCDSAARSLKAEISIMISNDMIMQSSTNHLCQAMDNVYKELVKIKGPGGPRKRMEQLERRVCSSNSIWMAVHDGVKDEAHKIFATELGKLKALINSSFKTIQKKFNTMCDDTVVKTEKKKKVQEKALRETLEEQLKKAKAIMDGPVREAADECRDYKSKTLFVSNDE